MKKILLLLLFPVVSMASGVGNGGFVIKCGSKTMLFDYYLAEQAGLHINVPQGKDYFEKFRNLLSRLYSIDPNRASTYFNQGKHLASGSYWNKEHSLQPIPPFLDVAEGLHLTADQVADPYLQVKFGLGQVSIPKDCELILAAQQANPMESNETSPFLRIKVILPVWESLDTDSQAGLIMHELFYEEFLLRNVTPQNATGVRKLNGLLGTAEFSNYSKEQWAAELRAQHFSPMYPDFKTDFGAINTPFLAGPDNRNDDYTSMFKMGGKGLLKICGENVGVQADTSRFFGGEIPENASVFETTVADFSCYTNGSDLKIQLLLNAPIDMDRYEISSGVSKIDVKDVGIAGRVFLKNYSNPNLKVVGTPAASIRFNPNSQTMNLQLDAADFTDIQVFTNGTWMHVNKSCTFDLSNGNVIKVDDH